VKFDVIAGLSILKQVMEVMEVMLRCLASIGSHSGSSSLGKSWTACAANFRFHQFGAAAATGAHSASNPSSSAL